MKVPKIYVASKVKHAPHWIAIRGSAFLPARIISTWIDEAGEGQTPCYTELAHRCVSEIAECDALLLYCEPGEILKGALLEAGVALGMGKLVLCVGDCESISRVFREHQLWSSHDSIQQALGSLSWE